MKYCKLSSNIINQGYHLKKSDKHEDLKQNFKLLSLLLPEIFPDEFVIQEIIKRHKVKKDSYRQDEFILDCLPLHLFDEKWLAEYLVRFVNEQGLADNITLNCINLFVKTKEFKTACQNFSDVYIKAKLTSMMSTIRLKHESITEIGFADISYRIDCDEFFRRHALSYFILKGFDPHTIEINLEKNADIWRKHAMLKAFENICNLEILQNDFPDVQTKKVEFYRKKYSFRKLWLRYREYEYYQRHKSVINELGLATDNMKISHKDADKLYYKMQSAYREMTTCLIHDQTNNSDLSIY